MNQYTTTMIICFTVFFLQILAVVLKWYGHTDEGTDGWREMRQRKILIKHSIDAVKGQANDVKGHADGVKGHAVGVKGQMMA